MPSLRHQAGGVGCTPGMPTRGLDTPPWRILLLCPSVCPQLPLPEGAPAVEASGHTEAPHSRRSLTPFSPHLPHPFPTSPGSTRGPSVSRCCLLLAASGIFLAHVQPSSPCRLCPGAPMATGHWPLPRQQAACPAPVPAWWQGWWAGVGSALAVNQTGTQRTPEHQ